MTKDELASYGTNLLFRELSALAMFLDDPDAAAAHLRLASFLRDNPVRGDIVQVGQLLADADRSLSSAVRRRREQWEAQYEERWGSRAEE